MAALDQKWPQEEGCRWWGWVVRQMSSSAKRNGGATVYREVFKYSFVKEADRYLSSG